MFQQIAVAVFMFSIFGTGDAVTVVWSTPSLTAGGKANITGKLKENSPSGLTAIKLKANNAASYEITNQPVENMFRIEDNGTLNLLDNSTLDYEKQTSYELTIKATKDATDTATAVLTLFIEDVNDNKPEFGNKEYRKTVANNTVQDTVIIQVTATDGDKSDTFNQVTYSIPVGNEAGQFDISTNGTIIAKKDIIVTNVITYNLTVQADDNWVADKMQGTTLVKICVGCTDSGTGQPGVLLSLMSLSLLLALQI